MVPKQMKNFLINIKLLVRESYLYFCFFLLPKKKVQKIVIFAQGRTGSSLLENLIANSSDISRNGEILAKLHSPFQRKIISPIKFVEGLSRYRNRDIIFHVKIYHLLDEQNQNPFRFFQKLSEYGWKVIYLRRDNKLNHAISNIVAERRNSFHNFNNDVKLNRFNIDIDELDRWIKYRQKYEAIEKDVMKEIDNYLELSYEDDLEDSENHEETIRKVFNYISLPYSFRQSNYKKVVNKSIKDIALNYDEIADYLKKNQLEKFLN